MLKQNLSINFKFAVTPLGSTMVETKKILAEILFESSQKLANLTV